MKSVCVIGIWHLGIVNAVGFAEQGMKVYGIEFDDAKCQRLKNGEPPLFEPGINELLKKHLADQSLEFSSDPQVAAKADAVVIAYDSPVNEKDEVDITPIVVAAEKVAPYLRPATVLVITSQLPMGSSEKIETLVRSKNPQWKTGVVYTPENLKLGTAIERFLHPDFLVLGANHQAASQSALQLYEKFETQKFSMNLRSAELVKHALNAFLATSISFINEIANLADRLDADAVTVGRALKQDQRIGPHALMSPGLGFSGGTLARDVTQLQKFSAETGYHAHLLDAVVTVNQGTFDEIVLKLKQRLDGNLSGKTIGILGLTYKPLTSTMRRSPAITMVQKLVAEGAWCVGYDPKASPEELQLYSQIIKRLDNVSAVARQADALLLVTEWPEFKALDFNALAKSMKRPILVDAKNFLDPTVLRAAGFDYQGFGRI